MLTGGTRVTLSSGARAQRVGTLDSAQGTHTNTIKFRRLIELVNREPGTTSVTWQWKTSLSCKMPGSISRTRSTVSGLLCEDVGE